MENFARKKKNGQIKGPISNLWLILYYTVQLIIPDVFFPNFKIIGQTVPEESLTK